LLFPFIKLKIATAFGLAMTDSGGSPVALFEKTNPKPAFGRKSEIRISKSDNSGGVAGRLLPRVGREMI